MVGTLIYSTHHFGFNRGIVWCWRCGRFSAKRAQGLLEVCKPSDQWGLKVLRRFYAGKTLDARYKWDDLEKRPEALRLESIPEQAASSESSTGESSTDSDSTSD